MNVGLLGGARDIEQADGTIGSCNPVAPALEHDVLHRDLSSPGGERLPWSTIAPQACTNKVPASRVERSECPAAQADELRVAVAYAHRFERHAELVGEICAKLVSCPWPVDCVAGDHFHARVALYARSRVRPVP
jgi:hypothetical protein